MKRRMSVVLVALLLLSLLLPCALAENGSMAITDAAQNKDDLGLEIKIANSFENADKLENYKVTLGGNELAIRSMTAGEGDGPVPIVLPSNDSGTSWIFLVDTSTVATNDTPYKVIDTLTSLFDMIGMNDNAALVSTAMTYGPEYLTTDPQRLKNLMETGTTNYDPSANRLYDAVLNSLDFLETNENAKTFKSLVVLSKGDNRNGSVSLDDVLDRIEASNVAVYTIAYINSSDSREFGEMAQASADKGNGGAAINLDTVGSSTVQAEAASIIRSLERKRKRDAGGFVAPVSTSTKVTEYTIKTEQPKEKGVDNTVVVSFTEGDQTVSAAYYIQDVNFPSPDPDDFFEWFVNGLKHGNIACVGIVAGAAVLLVLIVVVIMLALGRKNAQNASSNYNAGEVVPPPGSFVSQVESAVSETVPASGVDTPPQRKRLQLSLREASGQSHRAMLTKEGISAGRQGDNHVVLDSEDKHISRHHFVIKLVGDEVVLENISETNGTYVNGMRVEGPIALRQKDIIRVGDSEMTVTWKFE